MTACEECWAKAHSLAARTGMGQAEAYGLIVRQPRSHCHGLPVSNEDGATE